MTNSATDGWKVLDGTAAFGDTGREIGTGEFKMPTEDINANYYPYGWQEINYDDSNWSTTLDKGPITDENSRILTPYSAENTLRSVSYTHLLSLKNKKNKSLKKQRKSL